MLIADLELYVNMVLTLYINADRNTSNRYKVIRESKILQDAII